MHRKAAETYGTQKKWTGELAQELGYLVKTSMKFNGKLSNLIQTLRKNPDPYRVLSHYFHSLPEKEIPKAFLDAQTALPQYSSLLGEITPREYSGLLDWSGVFRGDANRNLLVNAAELSFFSQKINRFLVLESKFDHEVLSGQLDEANRTLSMVQDELGVSLWLLETKLSFLELYKGIEAQKNFSNSIINAQDSVPALKSVAYFFSMKAERTVSVERYLAALRSAFPFDQLQDGSLLNYFLFKLGFFSDIRFNDLDSILVFERSTSLIDRYLSMIRVCQLVAVDKKANTGLKRAVEACLLTFADKITDARVENLANAFDIPRRKDSIYHKERSRFGASFLGLVDSYTSGVYVPPTGLNGLPNSSEDFSAIEVYARTLTRQNHKPVFDAEQISYRNILEMSVEVLAKGPHCFQAFDRLLKMVYTFSNAQWAAKLYGFLMHEFASAPGPAPQRQIVFGELNGTPYSPKLLSLYFVKKTRIHETALTKAVKETLTFKFLWFSGTGNLNVDAEPWLTKVPENRILKYVAFSHLTNSRPKLAAEHFRRVLHTGDSLDTQDATVGLIETALAQNDLTSTCRQASVALIHKPELRSRVPLLRILQEIENANADRTEIFSTIYPSVCYGLYNQYYGNDHDDRRTIACEEFLLFNNISRPSQLRTESIEIENKLLIFFLRHVCIPDVLDSHVEYDGSLDVENERIAVLQLLIELDEENRSLYAEEIARITQRQLILEGVQAVEKSKIYVDVAGIRAVTLKEGRDLYTRFQSLPRADSSLAQVVLELEKILKNTTRGSRLQLVLPANERLAVLRQIYAFIRDKFVSSNEYGLDVYLSVGIRHGTLSGQLRSVLEKDSLVTQKNEEGSYGQNDDWTQILEIDGADPAVIEEVNKALATFSSSVDELIGNLRNSWIQVKTEEKTSMGLFDFSITQSDVLELNQHIEGDAPFEEVIDTILDALWRKTDASLDRIRSSLNTGFKRRFTETLDTCVKQVSLASDGKPTQKLRSSLAAARTELQGEIDNITAWFTRNSKSSSAAYQISLAIDIALEMVKRCYPQQTLDVTRDIKITRDFSGSTLNGMVNILYFAFDNILDHCGSPSYNPKATIRCLPVADGLELVLISTTFNTVDLALENQRLSELLGELQEPKASDRVRREGGTGLSKMAKTARVDFDSTLGIQFGYISENAFSLTLRISNGGLFV